MFVRNAELFSVIAKVGFVIVSIIVDGNLAVLAGELKRTFKTIGNMLFY